MELAEEYREKLIESIAVASLLRCTEIFASSEPSPPEEDEGAHQRHDLQSP